MNSFCSYSFLIISMICCSISCTKKPDDTVLKPEAFQTSFAGTKGAVLIDVRTPEEFEQGHLKGALNYNIHDSAFVSHASSIDKSIPVYVYCRKGTRSTDAADQLHTMGYKSVYNLEGGITEWEQEGLPIEK